MKIGDTVRRGKDADPMTIHDIDWLEQHKAVHQGGVDYEVLVNGEWKPVPRVTIHQRKVPDSCISCEG